MPGSTTSSKTQYKVHVMQTGEVQIEPELAFGGDHSNLTKASGFSLIRSPKIWLPVMVFLVETPHGLLLLDTGWDRSMSPEAVVISHLDCDRAEGLPQFKAAKQVLVAKDEYDYALKHRVCFYPKWWKDAPLNLYERNDNQGPFGKSYDVFGDGTVELINILGHTAGLVATRITNPETGKFFLYYGDGGYGEKSWKEQVTSGISMDKSAQKKSLAWIGEQSVDPNCVASLACHGIEVKPHAFEF